MTLRSFLCNTVHKKSSRKLSEEVVPYEHKGVQKMDLDEYLWRLKMSQGDFGELVGLSQRTVSLLVNKKVTPCLETAIAIFDATSGEVDYKDLVKKPKNKKP